MPASPTPLRQIVCALIVGALAVALWGFIQWRSAAPPPPTVILPSR